MSGATDIAEGGGHGRWKLLMPPWNYTQRATVPGSATEGGQDTIGTVGFSALWCRDPCQDLERYQLCRDINETASD